MNYSQILKRRWKDKRFAAAMSKKRKEMWKSKTYRRNHINKMKNKWKDKKFYAEMSRILKERWNNPKYRKKLSKIHKQQWKNSKYRKNVISAIIEADKNPNIRAKLSAAGKKHWTQANKNKNSKRMCKLWKNKKFKKYMLSKLLLKGSIMSKFEKRILDIMQKNNLPFRYTGNGKFIIAGKCPDFVHTNKKIFVEAYEDYWKSKNGMTPERYVRERRKIFAKEGYQTVFIHIKDSPDLVLKKLIKVN